MTSLVAWVGADTRGPSSLNLATDSRITWPAGASTAYHWDHGKKVFASATAPLVVGFVGDVLFPALMLPSIIDRVDRSVFRADGSTAEGLIAALRREWREYPISERRPLSIYIAYRIGEGMSASFKLTSLTYQTQTPEGWTREDIPVPPTSTCLATDGSGRIVVQDALATWQASSAAGTSRAIFSGFVDSVISGMDPRSGGAPQLGCIYRKGSGRLLGIVHNGQRYFAGSHLIGDEALDGVEWRNSLFERTDGRTKARLCDAQPQPRPSMHP